MASPLSQLGKFVFDKLSLQNPDKLAFKKFEGSALAEAAATSTPVASSGIQTVVLNTNPQQLSVRNNKITTKVPTNAPGRFVVFDWGNDLVGLGINGTTGNLFPDVLGASSKALGSLANAIDSEGMNDALGYANKANRISKAILQAGMPYTEFIGLSPAYKSFTDLQTLYDTFDADLDVLTLEMMNSIYRGYFEDFSFAMVANDPWQYKYSITYIIMQDISQIRKTGKSRTTYKGNVNRSV